MGKLSEVDETILLTVVAGDGYPTVYICQNLKNYTLKKVNYTVYRLNPNNKGEDEKLTKQIHDLKMIYQELYLKQTYMGGLILQNN